MPESDDGMADKFWFNMWQRRLWPYEELVASDQLYWYESPNKRIVWKTRVSNVDRFPYSNKDMAKRRLKERFGAFDESQPYFIEAPHQGFCLAWRVRPLQRLDLPKPTGFSVPRQGWLRVDDTIAQKWLSQSVATDDSTLDDIVPSGNVNVTERLLRLNEAMSEVSIERVSTIVSQTIRRDTQLIKSLKEFYNFQCQFTGCGVRIPKLDGGFYIEVAHIKPVSKGGQSVLGNLIVLCPNHHKEFDYGAVDIATQTTEIVRGKLNDKEFNIRFSQASAGAR